MRRLWRILRWPVAIGLLVWGALALLDWIGPSLPVELDGLRDPGIPVAGIDAHLAETEAEWPTLRPDARKRVVWAGEPGTVTPLSVVYLHGFSASAEEIRPVPDRLAAALVANLYFARLSGHGRDAAAMGEPSANDWIADAAEAVAIGSTIGERVILIGTSTGGALAAIAAANTDLAGRLAGLALFSPNFRLSGFGGRVAEWPLARQWGPLAVGAERGFTPVNEAHEAHWTNRYPTTAIAELGALTRAARQLDFAAMTTPALFFISQQDRVVDSRTTREIAARWGAASQIVPVVMVEGDDPMGHVLAGDILSPAKTDRVVERLVDWARQL